MKRGILPLLPLMLLTLSGRGAAEVPINGVTIGSSVTALAQTLGPPANVTSGDSGHRFDFANGTTAYADDDGLVLAIDTHTGTPRIDIDGTVRAFAIGTYSVARADAELANLAEFATPTMRSYRLAPRRDLVFGFSASSERLERVTYGEPGQLTRLGLLSGDAAAKAVAYRAPRLRSSAVAVPETGPLTSVYRIAIDRTGSIAGVDIVIPSAVPASDAATARALWHTSYTPASLDGRPIAAAIFVELHH